MVKDKRIALVTGGIQGLGAAAAKALQDKDIRVAVGYLGNSDRAESFCNETGISAFEWDVSNLGACEENVRKIVDNMGEIDILVNNAGVNKDKMFHKMTREEWEAVINVDLGSMFNVTRQVINGMRERGFGRIINMSSVNAQKGQAGQTNYCAAKAGVQGFTKALAREVADKGVTVNAIAPGYADTPMVETVPEEVVNKILAEVPLHRLAQPEEIGRCVAFLASENAGFITGATLCPNGGFYMN